jgi:hypothetical protein
MFDCFPDALMLTMFISILDLRLSGLINITSDTSDQTKAGVSAAAVAGFMSLLGSPHPVVAEQAVWAFGNIADDRPKLRDIT